MPITLDFWSHKTLIKQLETIERKSMFFCLTRQSLLCTILCVKDVFCCTVLRDEGLSTSFEKLLFQTKEHNAAETNVKCKSKFFSSMQGIVLATCLWHLDPVGSAWIGIVKCISPKEMLCSTGAVLLTSIWEGSQMPVCPFIKCFRMSCNMLKLNGLKNTSLPLKSNWAKYKTQYLFTCTASWRGLCKSIFTDISASCFRSAPPSFSLVPPSFPFYASDTWINLFLPICQFLSFCTSCPSINPT